MACCNTDGTLAYLVHDAGLEVMDDSGKRGRSTLGGPAHGTGAAHPRRKPVLIAGEPQYSDKPAQTLARETGVPAAQLDPVASGPADAPLSYYEAVMTANCKTLERYFDPR